MIQPFILVSADVEQLIQSFMLKTDVGWMCTGCDYNSKHKHVLTSHVEVKHVNIGGASCQFCSKVCPTRHALQMHVKRNHQ